jgi:hypothetical protein
MERAKVIRGLRIAWSVWWGILCVLLVVLWIDSYWHCRYIDTRYYRLQIMATTLRGTLGLDVDTDQTSSGPGTGPKVYWRFVTFPAKNRDHGLVTDRLRVISFLGFRWVSTKGIYEADLPFWMISVLLVATSAVPWIHLSKRYSLRTLLIATTLIAVVLGLVVWSM